MYFVVFCFFVSYSAHNFIKLLCSFFICGACGNWEVGISKETQEIQANCNNTRRKHRKKKQIIKKTFVFYHFFYLSSFCLFLLKSNHCLVYRKIPAKTFLRLFFFLSCAAYAYFLYVVLILSSKFKN